MSHHTAQRAADEGLDGEAFLARTTGDEVENGRDPNDPSDDFGPGTEALSTTGNKASSIGMPRASISSTISKK